MRRSFLCLLCPLLVAAFVGCEEAPKPQKADPKAGDGIGRPRPGDEKSKGGIPKGAMAPMKD